MSIITEHRRGTRANAEANTPAVAELWWDTTLNAVRMGDGATLGGYLQKRWGYSYPLSPAQITANQNDYAPTDFAIAETIYLTSDAVRSITGLAGGYAGARRTIVNRGSFDITLVNSSGSSTAANRFLFEADIVIRPNGSMEVQYSVTDSRWMRGTGGTKFSTIPQDFLLTGVITPAQITANQNDYAPADAVTATKTTALASILRLNSDASRNITGIVDPRDGAIKTIINAGSNPIVLKNADAGSTAANRFDFGADVTLAAKQSARIRYDGTDSRWKLEASTAGAAVGAGAVIAQTLASSGVAHGPIVNGYLEWTVAGSALTIALKTLAGADPSAGDPVLVWVRNATAAPASGTPNYSLLTITAALSLVVSSGSAVGVAANNTAFRLWAVLFNDAGTARIGVINCLSGTSISALSAWGIGSSTAEGGAGAADAAQTCYTGTAVASKPYAMLGYATWESGLAAAGTWSAGPTRAQTYGPGVPLPGQPVQQAITTTGSLSTGTTVIPGDNTIPQNTEGDQYLSQAILPNSGANLLEIAAVMYVAHSTANVAMALFQDSGANALACGWAYGNGVSANIPLRFREIANTTSSTTFKVRAGGFSAGTLTVNGFSGGQFFNGTLISSLAITEIMT